VIKVMYLIKPLNIGLITISPGLVEVDEIDSLHNLYFLASHGYRYTVDKKLFVEPHPLMMELF